MSSRERSIYRSRAPHWQAVFFLCLTRTGRAAGPYMDLGMTSLGGEFSSPRVTAGQPARVAGRSIYRVPRPTRAAGPLMPFNLGGRLL